MAYADYVFYRDTFKGGKVLEAEFDRLSNKSSLIIDRYVGGEIVSPTERVKLACCAIAEILLDFDQSTNEGAGGAVQSESTGGWSISYVAGSTKSYDQRIEDEIYLYLGGSGLLSQAVPYRGGIAENGSWRRS